MRHDRGIALADARGLDDDEVEAGDLARGDRVAERGRELARRFSVVARRERAHEHVRGVDRVHADAVAEQRAAGLPPRRVDGEHRDVQPVALVEPEAAHQLVGERGFPRAAGAGDAERRDRALVGFLQHLVAELPGRAALERGDQPRERPAITAFDRLQILRCVGREILVAPLDHVVDHALQAHLLAVLGRIDARDAVVVQLLDLRRHDHAAAAAEHLDVLAAALAQQVEHVLEVLDVAALVGADGDALRVLLKRRGDHLFDRAVVAEVDHLAAGGLQDPPHDVDRRVVAVEERRRGHEADLVLRLVGGELAADAEVGHPGYSRVRATDRKRPAGGWPAAIGLDSRTGRAGAGYRQGRRTMKISVAHPDFGASRRVRRGIGASTGPGPRQSPSSPSRTARSCAT